ncbi:S24 family peptidase [Actinoplanes sp. NPDC049596]|uniref:LexA family protein n=1 Tax=unclassified Actinoplanes TaxID=2626549 RepID=UPI0034446F2F
MIPAQFVGDEDLSARQRRILSFLREWTGRHGYPPTIREIGDAVGLTSSSSVAYQLRQLERKGHLRRRAGRPLLADRWDERGGLIDRPLSAGRAADRGRPIDHPLSAGRADERGRPIDRPLRGERGDERGRPLVAGEDVGGELTWPRGPDGALALPRAVVGEGSHFMLRVRGDAMQEAGIRDGDLAVVRRQATAGPGDIVAVMTGGATVVRFFEGDGTIVGRVVAVLSEL